MVRQVLQFVDKNLLTEGQYNFIYTCLNHFSEPIQCNISPETKDTISYVNDHFNVTVTPLLSIAGDQNVICIISVQHVYIVPPLPCWIVTNYCFIWLPMFAKCKKPFKCAIVLEVVFMPKFFQQFYPLLC